MSEITQWPNIHGSLWSSKGRDLRIDEPHAWREDRRRLAGLALGRPETEDPETGSASLASLCFFSQLTFRFPPPQNRQRSKLNRGHEDTQQKLSICNHQGEIRPWAEKRGPCLLSWQETAEKHFGEAKSISYIPGFQGGDSNPPFEPLCDVVIYVTFLAAVKNTLQKQFMEGGLVLADSVRRATVFCGRSCDGRMVEWRGWGGEMVGGEVGEWWGVGVT